MKAILVFAFAAFFLLFSDSASNAQGSFRDTSYSHAHDRTQVMGSEFWFAPPQIFANAGEYYQLNITSPKNTTVHIQTGTISSTINVTAGKTTAYSLPLTQVIKTSGIVEDKGYHVWSDSATLDLMLVVDYSIDSAGDAIHIIPDFQLGNQYAVASYQAYFVGDSSLEYDYPSMFTIAAPHDSTYITIIPSADLRMETETTPDPTDVAHRKGYPFTIRLDRGESVQFKTVRPQDLTNYDLTGTIVRSTFPVAVIGASERAAIPSDHNAHPDFIADMIPPTRLWDSLYYSMPFYQPAGVQGHNASTFAVIGSVANQSIYITDASGDHLFALLDHAFDVAQASDVELASQWHSSAAFLLAQYVNAADYPTPDPGVLGSPAMMIVPPPSQFALSSVAQVPITNGTFATQFSSFMNVIVNSGASYVTMDGMSIRSWPKTTLPDGTVIYHNTSGTLITGAHLLQSDAPLGETLYGYAVHSGETITYPATNGLFAPPGTDSLPPTVTWNEEGSCATANILDINSGISHIEIDSVANFTLLPDSEFAAGDSVLSTPLEACVIDTNKNSVLRLTAYDMAGNRTTSELRYTAPVKTTLIPGFTTQAIAFDTCLVGTSKTLAAVTITDTSSYWPLTVDSIWFDNPVFTDTAGADKFPFAVQPLASHKLQIVFAPTEVTIYTSGIHILTSAGTQTVTLRGSGYLASSVSSAGPSDLAEWLANGAGEAMLLPISPNPASGSLALTYALRAPAPMTFDLFTIAGASVFHRSLGPMASGIHTTMLDLPPLASGSYVFRFSAGSENHSGKLEIR